jgi:hypothetical protein
MPPEPLALGPGCVPWQRAQFDGWARNTADASEVTLLSLADGYTTACDAYFNPQGQAIPAATYELRLYTRGENFRCLIAAIVLTSGPLQLLKGCAAGRIWDVAIGLLQPAAVAAWNPKPTIGAYAHGLERG